MSSVDPFVSGSTLSNYRLGERVSSTVWQAEDTRTGKKVAVKVLAKQLPKEGPTRERIIRDIRVSAAIYHPSLVGILEVTPAGDGLILVMDWFDGRPASTAFRNHPADRTTFFRIAYQLADGLKMLHAKNVIHGNVNGDSVLVGDDGQIKLAGLNVTNLMPKREGPTLYQQKGSDIRAVSYMAPEQIKGDPLTIQSDVFSAGVVLYEASTGRLPYLGASAGEVARKIVEEQPTSPKTIHPTIENAVLGVMGRCLFKDPFKRYKDPKAIIDDINRVEPQAAEFATAIAKAMIAGTVPTQGADTRDAFLFVADIADYEQLNATDPASAQKAASRMQQILGEAVYLFDGQVLDPFGPRMVGELPSLANALEAGRKGEFDFSIEQQGSAFIPVRLLLHAGEVETHEGKVVGPAVDRAAEVLKELEPLQLYISEDFARRGRGNARLRDAGARGGVKLYTIIETEETSLKTQAKRQAEAAAEALAQREAEEAAAAAAAAAAVAAKRKRTQIAVIGGGLTIALAAFGIFVLRKPHDSGAAAIVASGPAQLPPATAAHPRKILLAPFSVETADPLLQQRAQAIRLAATEVLSAFPEIRIAKEPGADVTSFTATVRGNAAAPQLVPATSKGVKRVDGPAVVIADAAAGIQSIVQWVSGEVKLPHATTGNAEAYNAFTDAVTATAAGDDAKADGAIRAATKADPNLLAAQLLAMRFFYRKGNDADAVAAAKQVVALDRTNPEASRLLGRAEMKSGDEAGAIGAYGTVLQRDPNDAEALNVIGRYAFSAGDAQKLAGAIHRLASAPNAAAVHEPDALLSTGRIDAAVDKYYDIEQRQRDNPALALKIARIAVLRHSQEIAQTELQQLQRLNYDYGVHLIKAYIAAEGGAKNDAAAELKAAQAFSRPGDDYWTSAAEIAAIEGDTAGILDALERAADRKEPTVSYVLSNPLFTFLSTDPRFQKLQEKLRAQQAEIRAALAGVAL